MCALREPLGDIGIIEMSSLFPPNRRGERTYVNLREALAVFFSKELKFELVLLELETCPTLNRLLCV